MVDIPDCVSFSFCRGLLFILQVEDDGWRLLGFGSLHLNIEMVATRGVHSLVILYALLE